MYSLSANKKKCLNEHCVGGFSTAPNKLCLYLYEINLNLADSFPFKVGGKYCVCVGGYHMVGW